MNNKGFSAVEAIAAMIILTLILTAAYTILDNSAIQSEITKTRVDDSTVSRGVANYINSFTFDDIDSRLSGDYQHINSQNCGAYLSAACVDVLSPTVNSLPYGVEDLFVIVFRPTANVSTIKDSNNLYNTQVDSQIDKFTFNKNQGKVIYFLVVNRGAKDYKFTQRGILTEEETYYAD